ncbi:MAG: hypothetical protein KIT48_04600 [Pseudolabrys sp.]|nr:hypothetical protein [Pseudolabrys sp.]
MSDEAAILATLRPCVDGPLTGVAVDLIVTGRAAQYASCRVVVREILEARKKRTGRTPKANFDERARVHNLIRDSMARGHTREFAIRQARARTKLDDGEFADASNVKPSWETRKRAQELRRGRELPYPTSRLDSDDDLTSDHVQPAT